MLCFRPCKVVPVVAPRFLLVLLTQVFLVGFSSWLVRSPVSLSTSEDGEGDYIEVPSGDGFYSLLFVGTVFAVGFTMGVGSAVCFNPFSGGFVALATGRFGAGIAGHVFGRNFRDPLDIDVTQDW